MSTDLACRHPKTIRIVYGLPDLDLMRRAEEGNVALGGCMAGPAARRCIVCDADVHEEEE